MRLTLLGSLLLVATACSSPSSTDSGSPVLRDTVSYHANGSPKLVHVQQDDSVLSRQTYRPTGTLRRVVTADSVQTYFDLNDPDSASVLKDYLQGRWRNLSADTTSDRASAFYIFDGDNLIFENAAAKQLETLSVTYNDKRRLVTETGMTVRPAINSFDTVEVTGYTLVRHPPSDSL